MNESPALYKEQQEFPFRRGLFMVFFLMFAAIPVFLNLPWWMTLGILLIGLLTASLVHSFTIMRVVITREYLQFGYWVSAPKLRFEEIKHYEVADIPKLAGIGIHRWGSYWVYNARWGRGLKVKGKKKSYMIGSDTPEQLCSALNDAAKRRPEL